MENKTDPTNVGMVENPKNANCEKEVEHVGQISQRCKLDLLGSRLTAGMSQVPWGGVFRR
jgi:hypothetical protein